MPLPDGSPFPPEARPANYRYWATCPTWYRHEAVSLALGLEPDTLSPEAIFNNEQRVLAKPRSEMDARDLLIEAYLAFDRHITRRFGLLGYKGLHLDVQPETFLKWMRQVDIPVPDGMAEAIEGASIDDDEEPQDSPMRSSDEGLGSRERESLLKLVIGMAVKGYGYDPKASRSDKVSEIAGDLTKLGIPLTDDTVRKYLREARDLLPPETE